MYDYMKALLQRFDTHSEQAAALEKSIEKNRKNLANRLTKSERKMLLRLSDLEDALRDEANLNASCVDIAWQAAFIRSYRNIRPIPLTRKKKQGPAHNLRKRGNKYGKTHTIR